MTIDRPGVLALDHDQTLTFVETVKGVSHCLPDGIPGDTDDIGHRHRIRKGYASLAHLENRAVVHRGRLLLPPVDRRNWH